MNYYFFSFVEHQVELLKASCTFTSEYDAFNILIQRNLSRIVASHG